MWRVKRRSAFARTSIWVLCPLMPNGSLIHTNWKTQQQSLLHYTVGANTLKNPANIIGHEYVHTSNQCLRLKVTTVAETRTGNTSAKTWTCRYCTNSMLHSLKPVTLSLLRSISIVKPSTQNTTLNSINPRKIDVIYVRLVNLYLVSFVSICKVFVLPQANVSNFLQTEIGRLSCYWPLFFDIAEVWISVAWDTCRSYGQWYRK